MSPKNAATFALLMFVAASLVVLTVKSLRQPPQNVTSAGQSPAGGTSTDVVRDEPTLTDGVAAYYMHGNVRCPTCMNIEKYAHEAVTTGFAEELKSGNLQWRVVNYEQPGNEHWATEFELAAPSVVLVKMSGGTQTHWKNLPEVWELVGDKPAFVAFVQKEVRELLDAGAAGTVEKN